MKILTLARVLICFLIFNISMITAMNSPADEQLKTAILHGTITGVQHALSTGANLHCQYEIEPDKMPQRWHKPGILLVTPLFLARYKAQIAYEEQRPDQEVRLRILELLLRERVDLNTPSGSELETSLEETLNEFYPIIPIIKMYIRYGACIQNADTIKNAITKKSNIEIKSILEEHIDLIELVKTNPNKEALHCAIKNDYHLVFLELVKRGVSVDEHDLALAKNILPMPSKRIIGTFIRNEFIKLYFSRCFELPEEVSGIIIQYLRPQQGLSDLVYSTYTHKLKADIENICKTSVSMEMHNELVISGAFGFFW